MEVGLEMVYVEKYNEGNKWGLMNFDGNDNGGSEIGGDLMELRWRFEENVKKKGRWRVSVFRTKSLLFLTSC